MCIYVGNIKVASKNDTTDKETSKTTKNLEFPKQDNRKLSYRKLWRYRKSIPCI